MSKTASEKKLKINIESTENLRPQDHMIHPTPLQFNFIL
jgi:hypothetical protein